MLIFGTDQVCTDLLGCARCVFLSFAMIISNIPCSQHWRRDTTAFVHRISFRAFTTISTGGILHFRKNTFPFLFPMTAVYQAGCLVLISSSFSVTPLILFLSFVYGCTGKCHFVEPIFVYNWESPAETGMCRSACFVVYKDQFTWNPLHHVD